MGDCCGKGVGGRGKGNDDKGGGGRFSGGAYPYLRPGSLANPKRQLKQKLGHKINW